MKPCSAVSAPKRYTRYVLYMCEFAAADIDSPAQPNMTPSLYLLLLDGYRVVSYGILGGDTCLLLQSSTKLSSRVMKFLHFS